MDSKTNGELYYNDQTSTYSPFDYTYPWPPHPDPDTCPYCGRCRGCGRRATAPYTPFIPYVPITPYWGGTTTNPSHSDIVYG